MTIVFFGSDDFAAVHLEALIAAGHHVTACVTQPDARQGRGMRVVVSPIKAIAQEKRIPCLQPQTLKDPSVVQQLREFDADLFVVVAYGRLLPQAVLDIPKVFCINVHGSLLPKYRGAAPINWAIINGEKQTGVTIQKMALGLDTGDIIAQEIIVLSNETEAVGLRVQMAKLGSALLTKTVDSIAQGTYSLTTQQDERSSYAKKLSKEMGRIDWSKSASAIDAMVRGLKPWPGTYTLSRGKILKVLSTAVVTGQSGKPGEAISIDANGILVACGQDALLIKEVLLEGAKPMPAADYARGCRLKNGEEFPS